MGIELMKRRSVVGAFGGICLLLTGFAGRSPAQGAAAPLPFRERIGVSTHLPTGQDAAAQGARAQELRLLAEAGVRWIRRDFFWHEIEPARGTFHFVPYDQIVDEAAEWGISFLALLAYGNPWASERGEATGDPHYPPDDPADFARYAARVVAHFSGRVRFFEIWNEENVGVRFWKPTIGGDPQAYGRLLSETFQAIEGVDPEARVVFGGTFYPHLGVPGTSAFVGGVFRFHPDIGEAFDIFAYHPYRYPFTAPEVEAPVGMPGGVLLQESLASTIARVREILARRGGNHPLWITELGWHTAGPVGFGARGVCPLDQARYLVRSAVIAIAGGVERFFWYTYGDGPRSAHDQEDAFGLVGWDEDPTDATPPERKPAYFALETMLDLLGDAVAVTKTSLAEGLFAFTFQAPARVTVVVWQPAEGAREVTLPLSLPCPRWVGRDLFGGDIPVATGRDGVSVTVSPSPIYLICPLPSPALTASPRGEAP